MTLQTVLAIASLALSIGGLVNILLVRDKGRVVSITVIVSAIAILSTVMLYDNYLHQRRVGAVAAKIVEVLGTETRTFDDVYGDLYYVEFPLLNEALDRLVSRDVVGHRVLELQDRTGHTLRVRGYYAK